MLEIYNLKDKQEYMREIAILTQKEWGQKNLSEQAFQAKIQSKIEKMKSNFDNPKYCKLLLVDDSNLIGFISIFPSDGEERKDLSPWYATMYVKKEYRGNEYSKLLHHAILSEARKRNMRKLYLKTELNHYYEKFGAIYLDTLQSGEKVYYFDIPTNRISIIGGSGSGKSTLATILSKEFLLPVIHLDAINYNANWVPVDKNVRDKIIMEKSNSEKWIIDGNYNKTLKERLQKSDLIIWLDYSTFAHLKGIFKRIIQNFNKDRFEIPGCKERIDLSFIQYVFTYNKKKRPKVVDLLKDIPKDKLLIFKNQKDLNAWLRNFINCENISSIID